MLQIPFEKVFLPYCLERVDDGRYVVLNRQYKPLGVTSPDHVDYALHAVKLNGLTPTLAQKISHSGSQDTAKIFLYDNVRSLRTSARAMREYLDRLAILSKATSVPKKK